VAGIDYSSASALGGRLAARMVGVGPGAASRYKYWESLLTCPRFVGFDRDCEFVTLRMLVAYFNLGMGLYYYSVI